MLADVLGEKFSGFRVPGVALERERSFWEKATVLQAAHLHPALQTLGERVARLDVLKEGVRPTSRCFASGWANDGPAAPGWFRPVPPAHRHQALARDLEAMRPLFPPDAPTFAVLLEQLGSAEEELNRTT